MLCTGSNSFRPNSLPIWPDRISTTAMRGTGDDLDAASSVVLAPLQHPQFLSRSTLLRNSASLSGVAPKDRRREDSGGATEASGYNLRAPRPQARVAASEKGRCSDSQCTRLSSSEPYMPSAMRRSPLRTSCAYFSCTCDRRRYREGKGRRTSRGASGSRGRASRPEARGSRLAPGRTGVGTPPPVFWPRVSGPGVVDEDVGDAGGQ